MSTITRHALRVYAALTELKGDNADVLDALVPFFEPILEVMNGKVFDPKLLAAGVGRMYRWRFTRDVAEQFIPRLERHGYLERKGTARDGTYIVRYASEAKPGGENATINDLLTTLINEFQIFAAALGDVQSYQRSREQLIDVLIRFLVSTDAFGGAPGSAGNGPVGFETAEAPALLEQIEEGGRPLSSEDRYVAARFVRHVTEKDQTYAAHLGRLASIGLLTEVVDDFVKPTAPPTTVDLTLILDAPLALDYLGLSGKALKDDVRFVVDALRAIGCKVIVLSISCGEMQRNLTSMLKQPYANRYGFTHQAMQRREVDQDYVEAVARNPEQALETAGIEVRNIAPERYPNISKFFDNAKLDDFLSYVTWVPELAPREHDATCMALTIRLRQDRHHNDLFRCGYVFVTRNPAFARRSRDYCLQSRLINERQEGPVIHQRELATIAWLRTGLGAVADIPKAHLVAWCDHVLRVRPEVTDRVAARLRSMTSDKLEHYEVLLRDHRSVRRLADATLNDENVVTDENAEELLDLMRRATAEEERARHNEEMARATERHAAAQDEARARSDGELALREAQMADQRTALDYRTREVERLERAMAEQRRREAELVGSVARRVNKRTDRVAKAAAWFLIGLGLLGVYDFATGGLTGNRFWNVVVATASLAGLYHLITDVLQTRKYGLRTLLTWLATRSLKHELRDPALQWLRPEWFSITQGVVSERTSKGRFSNTE